MRLATFFSTKAGLSRLASFVYLNLTTTKAVVTAIYLTRLLQEMEVEVVAILLLWPPVKNISYTPVTG
jgi:hypothetical protein